MNEELLKTNLPESSFSRLNGLSMREVETLARENDHTKTSRFSNGPPFPNHSKETRVSTSNMFGGRTDSRYSHSNNPNKTPEKYKSHSNMFGSAGSSQNIFGNNSTGSGGSERVTRSSNKNEGTSSTANIFKTGGQSTGTSGG